MTPACLPARARQRTRRTRRVWYLDEMMMTRVPPPRATLRRAQVVPSNVRLHEHVPLNIEEAVRCEPKRNVDWPGRVPDDPGSGRTGDQTACDVRRSLPRSGSPGR